MKPFLDKKMSISGEYGAFITISQFYYTSFPIRDITDLNIISFTRLYTFEKKRG